MPMYNFECEACGKRFTALTAYDRRDDMRCPDCQAETRVLLASFAVKGSGGAGANVGAISSPSRGFS